MTDAYEPDEFDEIATRGGPVGVHRAPRPWWTRIVAPVLVFLLAGAGAYAFATYLWNRDIAAPGDGATPTVTSSVDESTTPSPSTSATTSPSTSSTPSPTATVSYGAKVTVLNGAGVAGLAAKNQKILEGVGFASVAADNLSSPKPSENVVVYEADAMKATAEAVAKALGITKIALDVTQSGSDVEAQLVTDPSK